ncbi:histidine kinase [Streptomyces griseorubiginosus]|uniref:histidine kinase n=1 Tax=Streptomyces griseorubiginosus TaxID=67304 RepID=UPI000D14F603
MVSSGAALTLSSRSKSCWDRATVHLLVELALCQGESHGRPPAGLLLRDADRRAVAELGRTEERLALARDLHDLVIHYVTGIVVRTQTAPGWWPRCSPTVSVRRTRRPTTTRSNRPGRRR